MLPSSTSFQIVEVRMSSGPGPYPASPRNATMTYRDISRRSHCLVQHRYRPRPKHCSPLLVRWSIYQQRQGRCCRGGSHAVCPADDQYPAGLPRPSRIRSRLATLILGEDREERSFRPKRDVRYYTVRGGNCDMAGSFRFRVSAFISVLFN